MSNTVKAYAALEPRGKLQPYQYDPGPLGSDQVEIAVKYCGVCHSDLSMLNNDWGNTTYPLIPGHEVIGTVSAIGDHVTGFTVGQNVGLGWYSGSCMHCRQCMSGDHNLCLTVEGTIIGRHGGFADRVRCNWEWAVPLPDGLDLAKAGPLFCGGVTVFNPIVQFDVKPTDRVGVLGIGGLGHLALQFLSKWGCDVTAFTTSDSKADEARHLGANHVVNSRDPEAMKKIGGSFDFLLSTVNADLDWMTYVNTLAPKGRLHFVGAVPKPVPLAVFPLLVGQRSVSASPLGSPATTTVMLDFCVRHGIAPVTEAFPMARVNDAIEHLESGKARYRIVLEN